MNSPFCSDRPRRAQAAAPRLGSSRSEGSFQALRSLIRISADYPFHFCLCLDFPHQPLQLALSLSPVLLHRNGRQVGDKKRGNPRTKVPKSAELAVLCFLYVHRHFWTSNLLSESRLCGFDSSSHDCCGSICFCSDSRSDDNTATVPALGAAWYRPVRTVAAAAIICAALLSSSYSGLGLAWITPNLCNPPPPGNNSKKTLSPPSSPASSRRGWTQLLSHLLASPAWQKFGEL